MRLVWVTAVACAIAVPSAGLAQRAPDVTFNPPGSCTDICTPHPSMFGQIIVTGQAVAEAPPTEAGPSTSRPQPQHGAH